MITTLFFTLCGFAAAHFIYERIALPSLRLHFRNELFRLRDIVRKEIIAGQLVAKDAKAAKLIHDGLNNTINRLHLLTLGNQVRVQMNFERNPEVRDKVKRNAEILLACDNEKLLLALKSSMRIMDYALYSNNFFFLLYVSPLVLSLMMVGAIVQTVSSSYERVKKTVKAVELQETILLVNDGLMRKVVASPS